MIITQGRGRWPGISATGVRGCWTTWAVCRWGSHGVNNILRGAGNHVNSWRGNSTLINLVCFQSQGYRIWKVVSQQVSSNVGGQPLQKSSAEKKARLVAKRKQGEHIRHELWRFHVAGERKVRDCFIPLKIVESKQSQQSALQGFVRVRRRGILDKI